MILIDSIYINIGGGKVLLDYLVETIEEQKINAYYLFDSRCIADYQDIPESRKTYLYPSLRKRYQFYRKNRDQFTSVFCFGNIPPTIKLKVPVYTYFHNILFVEKDANRLTISKNGIMRFLKKNIIKYLSKNTDYYVVQTQYGRDSLCEAFNFDVKKCLILPFFRPINTGSYVGVKTEGFVYISTAPPHKNHLNLLKAWAILAEKNIYPELHLTISDNFPQLIDYIKVLNDKGACITNHGFIDPTDLYRTYKFIIYPSLSESFGLGLIEGVAFGCNIVAANLDYVHNVVKPSLVFDPYDPDSIAESVRKALNFDYENESESIISNRIDKLLEIFENKKKKNHEEVTIDRQNNEAG